MMKCSSLTFGGVCTRDGERKVSCFRPQKTTLLWGSRGCSPAPVRRFSKSKYWAHGLVLVLEIREPQRSEIR